MSMKIHFDAALLSKYDTVGPRYTSYPTALQFDRNFNGENYRDSLSEKRGTSDPLSLYLHIPFCKSLCYYCACAKIITHKQARSIPYLQRLHSEIARQGSLAGPSRPVTQLHFGGGTPTFMSDGQLTELMAELARHFHFAAPDAREFSIEIDPRAVRKATIPLLRQLGFNRTSLGVQDFDPAVQQAVNRIQSVEQTFDVLDAARAAGYRSTNIDLIYGLPLQTVQSFSQTLETVLTRKPERLAIYNYAHLPGRVKAQRMINSSDLPAAATKLQILETTIARLEAAGYVHIGMDHFALPDDELALAKANGTLQRNFQGYAVQASTDLIGMGMTAISKIGTCFSQNQAEEEDYFNAIDSGHLAIYRGYELSKDDQIRADVIQSLMCRNEVSFSAINARHQIDFYDYFYNELRRLVPMVRDGLLLLDKDEITVTPAGQLLLRNIAMVFDAYLPDATTGNGRTHFSKVI